MKDNSKSKNSPDPDIVVDNIGHVKPRTIESEMQESYLTYAMSVIVTRALPDIRDGMKPVHRRILYAMHTLGLNSRAKTRKSATIVGEVLGKYHPHGDTAVYDSMVHMAQDFSMRYPLIIGQGNFGSMDGDNAAAMRYTEAKMSAIAEVLLEDIDKETVPFKDNYDSTRKEPSVLPGKLPNLLLNGTLGIAVGMATNIPPHNLTEVADALIAIIENPHISIDEITDIITGPDFPTGGIIFDKSAIKQAYATGKGGVVVRAKAYIEEMPNGNYRINITEIPYQVNKATLLEKIADLVKDKKIEGIKDVRDESDKDGVSIIIELKKDINSNKILNQLYQYTQLQDTFHLNTLALIDGISPQVLNIKTILENYVAHRKNMVVKRTEFDLQKAKDRAHILEGLKIALYDIDAIIKTIRDSKTKEEAFLNLIKKFKLSEAQSHAILEIRLQTLAGLERLKIETELTEKTKLIKELEAILASPKKILGIISKEVSDLKDKFGDERRTQVIPQALGQFNIEDLIPDNEVIINITTSGYIKRLSADSYRQQNRGGKGVMGQSLKEEDEIEKVITASTHDDLMFFTNKGRVLVTKAYEIPESSRTSKGQALVNFLQLGANETATTTLALNKNSKNGYLVMVTKKGLIKKVSSQEFSKVRRNGIIVMGLKDNDELKWVEFSNGKHQIMLCSKFGQAIRFQEQDIRPMGRAASGVTAMKLKKDDEIISMDIIDTSSTDIEQQAVLVVTENGMGKKTTLDEYRLQKRSGSGIKTLKLTDKTGNTVALIIITKENQDKDIVLISKLGQTIRTPLKNISSMSRTTQGVRLVKLDDNDKVASVTLI